MRSLLIIILLSWINGWTYCYGCEVFPSEGATKDDALLTIVGSPHSFVPSNYYTVELKSPSPYQQFFIIAEGSNGGGSFQIFNDRKAKLSDECANTVVNNDISSKTWVSVLWTSPPAGCINIRGGVLVEGGWTTANRSLCSVEDLKKTSPAKCCACDHAKYKLIFKGLWSPETHPKDFPSIREATHLSDLIGATHGSDFSYWREGGTASYGVQQMAEYGIVRELERELRNQSRRLRTIVRGAGLWYPDVNQETAAVFRVDPRHPLLSITSMLGPSPDWFVGVDSLSLCLPNCTWLNSTVLDLYPYDAGTDSGISYMSPNAPTDPPEKIHRITPMYPEDIRSPFYDPSREEVEPLARFTIALEKTTPKKCTDLTEEEILEDVATTENTEDETRSECEVSGYSEWSPCSVTCGKGIRQRSRSYLNSVQAKSANCDRQLVSKEMCAPQLTKCPGESEEETSPEGLASTCEVSAWTDWSDCSVTCGIGFKLRTRDLILKENSTFKKCMHISKMEKEKCMLPVCHSQEKRIPRACSVTDWSEWSPCSVTCGTGKRTRIRNFKANNPTKFCISSVNTTETIICKHASKCVLNSSEAEASCSLEITPGPCRGTFQRWAFDKTDVTCKPFMYGGCRGNKNNFESFDSCMTTCSSRKNSVEQKPPSGDCVMSKWGPWSSCKPCSNGIKVKTRTILKGGEGKGCPPLKKVVRCSVPPEFCNEEEPARR